MKNAAWESKPGDSSAVVATRWAGGAAWFSMSAVAEAGLPLDRASLAGMVERLLGAGAVVEQRFKDDRRSLVEQVALDGRRWVVKRYRGPGWKTWLWHPIRRTPAWREWQYGRRLRLAGVRAMDALALVQLHEGGRRSEAIVTPYVDAPSLHHWLKRSNGLPAGAEAARRLAVARAVGGQMGRIIAAGFVNHDHKASNLLIDATCAAGQGPPLLIDPARIKRRRGAKTVWLMTARLWRSTRVVGGCSTREALAALRQVLRTDPSLLADHPRRLRAAAEAVRRVDGRLQGLLERGRVKRAAAASHAKMGGSTPPAASSPAASEHQPKHENP